MLQRGGNAVDAALATAIALTVVEPCSNGIGSDLFAILWDGRELVGLNASGRRPAAVTPDRYRGQTAIPERSWEAVTIPGAVSAWVALSQRFGALAVRRPLRARRSAMRATVTPCRRSSRRNGRRPSKCCRTISALPSISCRPAAPSSPASCFAARRWLARSKALPRRTEIRSIAASSRTRWWNMPRRMVRLHAVTDFAEHTIDWVEPLALDYASSSVHEIPPNGQGIAALIALGILRAFDLASLPPDSLASQHLQIEA
jgi:gamma-glutamyltranspeptidase/glutathione hydrolase